MSSKQEPLWRSLWKLISGEWIAEVRREREQAQREMIEAMPMPPCGDKHRHFHQIAYAGYCVDCRVVEHRRRESAEREELAEMIAEKVAATLKREEEEE